MSELYFLLDFCRIFFYLINVLTESIRSFWTNFSEFGSVLSYGWSCGGVTQRSIAFSCGYCYFFIKGSFNNYVGPNFTQFLPTTPLEVDNCGHYT